MPAPIINFVDVTVNLTGATPEKFQFNSLLGAFTHAITANRQDGPYFNIQEVNDAGFTVGAAPTINAWASDVFSQDNGIETLLIGRIDAGDATLTASLDAIEAEDPGSFYILNMESRADADIALATAWVEARSGAGGSPRNIGKFQSDDLTVVAFTAMQSAGYNRSSGWYHATDGEYLDGAISSKGGGFNLDVPGGVGIWAYKQLAGIPFDPVTGAQATAIYAVGANLYGRNKGLSFTSKGTMASGRFIDVQTSLDWLAVRSEEALLAAFVGVPTKIGYDNAGINVLATAEQSVLDLGVTTGHLLRAEESAEGAKPQVFAPDVRTISSAVKATRELTMTATGTLKGAIQKVILTVNLIF